MKSTVLLICLAAAVGLLATTESKSEEQGKDATPSKPDASDKFIGKEAGQVRDDNGLKMKLIWCPRGLVTMEYVEVVTETVAEKHDEPNHDDDVDGANDKPAPEPRRTTKTTPVKVFLTKGYWLGKYEVTQAEWKQVMKTEPWKDQHFTKTGTDFPATFVSWDDATDFCRKLTDQEHQDRRLPGGWEYTLPTEAQWESACRAGSKTKFSFGDDELKLGEYAWFGGNMPDMGEPHPRRAGARKANSWGLHDMHGNVWEWCQDVYQPTLPGGRDPFVEVGSTNRVNRGGGWNAPSPYCRSDFRFALAPANRTGFLGFRIALSAVR